MHVQSWASTVGRTARPRSVRHQGEGGDGVGQRASVLLDVGIAHQQMLPLFEHFGRNVDESFLAGSQVGDRQLAGGGHVAVADGASWASPSCALSALMPSPLAKSSMGAAHPLSR